MKFLLIALLCAISYAQTDSDGQEYIVDMKHNPEDSVSVGSAEDSLDSDEQNLVLKLVKGILGEATETALADSSKDLADDAFLDELVDHALEKEQKIGFGSGAPSGYTWVTGSGYKQKHSFQNPKSKHHKKPSGHKWSYGHGYEHKKSFYHEGHKKMHPKPTSGGGGFLGRRALKKKT